jgi:Thioredoxin-like
MLPRLFALFIAIVIPGVMAGAAIVFLLADKSTTESGTPTQPVELGRVSWQRDYAAAVAQAKRDNKPLLVLFDEVPGCDTCTGFGSGPLSHPIVIDAANEFVPVAIYNNVQGKDAEVLKSFSEPPWNNPVVRFLSADEKDIIPRKDGVYTTPELLARMTAALKKAGRPVPEYLKLANAEANPAAREKAVFAMHCYWEGERLLGAMDGVLATRIGMLQGAEVVEVEFDPTVASYRQLLEKAVSLECAHQVFTRNDRQHDLARQVVGNKAVRTDAAIDADTQQQYHLSLKPAYHYLPLTQLQATKVNAALAAGESPDRFLSPGQLAMHKRMEELLPRDTKKLAGLKPDRAPTGIVAYTAKVDEATRR